MKTTMEVIKESGISYPMLNRLKDLGIVPKPKLRGLGRHKGVIGEFEDNIIDLIKWVRKQQGHNISLMQIAEQLRKAKIEEGEVVGPKHDSNLVKWATQRFMELHARYPDDDFVPGEIEEPFEERPDGTVVAKFRIRRIPRRKK